MESATNQRLIKYLGRAIWFYFFFLIFEGVFRKWLLPQFSDVLLIVRDPVVIVIYILAIKARVFPRTTGWFLSRPLLFFRLLLRSSYSSRICRSNRSSWLPATDFVPTFFISRSSSSSVASGMRRM
jgi:hypothetical protein